MEQPKKILFLSVAVGGGHARAAEAVEYAFHKKQLAAQTMHVDTFYYANPLLSKVIVGTYMEIIKNTPLIYRYLYQRAEEGETLAEFSKVLNMLVATKLERLVRGFQPDLIVCTHVFPCGMLAILKKRQRCSIPVVGVVTDFTIHPFWASESIELFIVGAHELKDDLVAKGVSAEKVKVAGIPIHPDFAKSLPKSLVKQKLGLQENLFTLLITGGSLGLGPMEEIVCSLGNLDLPMQMVVVVGKNEPLMIKLKEIIKNFRVPVKVFGYVNNIYELMEVADLLISKPGGLTSAEALAKGVPMVIVDPLPGQEERNTTFLLNRGAALKVDDENSLVKAISFLLTSPPRLREMQERARSLGRPSAALETVEIIRDKFFLNR